MQKSIWQINAKLIKKETTLQTFKANTESFQVNMRTSVYKNFQNSGNDFFNNASDFLQCNGSFPCLEQHIATL